MAERKRGGTLAERLAARAAAGAAPQPTRIAGRPEADEAPQERDQEPAGNGDQPPVAPLRVTPSRVEPIDETAPDVQPPEHVARGEDRAVSTAAEVEASDLDTERVDAAEEIESDEAASTVIDLDAHEEQVGPTDDLAVVTHDVGADEAEPAVEEAEPAVEEAEPPVDEAEPPVDEAEPAVDEAEPPADEVVDERPAGPPVQPTEVAEGSADAAIDEVPVTGGDRGFFAGRRARRRTRAELPGSPEAPIDVEVEPTPETAEAAAPAAEPITEPSAPPRRGVGRRLLPQPAARLTEREPRDVLSLAIAGARGVGLLSAAILLALSVGDGGAALPYAVGLAFGITLLRLWQPGGGLTAHIAETAVVAGILVASDGMLGPFSLFAAATALAVGADRGLGPGLLSGVILSSAGVVATTGALVGDVDAAIIGSWVVLYPLTGALGSLTARTLDVDADGQAALREVNRVLRSLRTVAHDAPAALQTATVARAVASELVETLEADGAIVLMERDGTLVEVGRHGDIADVGHLLLVDGWQPLVPPKPGRAADLTPPPRLRQLLGAHDWTGLALHSQQRLVGVVLLLGASANGDREHRRTVKASAQETAIALDNATIFSEIEQLAAGAERARIADDLHDGVAQQLTHVRFELELLARRASSDEVREEMHRLARVAGQATDDVRSSIRGLRATALDAGLATALQALVSDLDSSGGPEMILDIRAPVDLDVDVETEVFRIIQEALSNALRHAAADHVLIEVDDLDGTVAVVIEDDGEGLEATADDPSDGDGLGLATMQARAERIGGALHVGGNELGGVRVELRVPPRGMGGSADGGSDRG